MGIEVIDPGVYTTIQDDGRFGYQQYGVTPSGPMDRTAFTLANLLANNPEGTEELEMTLSGGKYVFCSDSVIALTGADMHPKINGAEIPMYRAISVGAGDELELGFASNGCRTYMAVSGGLDIKPVMGSKSTLTSKRLGGLHGRSLEKGDRVNFLNLVTAIPNQEKRALRRPIYAEDEIVLRVIPGPQEDGFDADEFRKFFHFGAEITNDFDRQGCRLNRDRPVRHKGDGNIISDGVAFGSIQIPPDGQPIVMMADRQTVGGYPKIGTVISADLPILAQARPGMRVRFISISIELAQEVCVREKKRIKRIAETWQSLKGGDNV